VRHLLGEGRVDEAGALLGHHYFIDGTVVRGDGRGRELGVPTANLETGNELVPPHGIYATLATVDGVCHRSVTSIGVRPTIGPGPRTIETHLLDGGRDLYGCRVRLAFVAWLRHEERFDSLEALTAAMQRDCRRAHALFDRIEI
jgi:riboflavin kinase/FMN adenylyltransferase